MIPLNDWWWVAVGATAGIYTIRSGVHGAVALASDSIDASEDEFGAELSFVMALVHFGAAAGTSPVHGKYGYIFEWDSEKSEAEILAQMASPSPIITADLLSFKSGLGATLAEALLGTVGATFVAGSGGVTLDTDGPSFGPTLTGTIQLPATQTIELVAPVIETAVASGTTAVLTVGNIDL